MERLATPALVLGLVGITAGGILRIYRPSWTAAWPVALIAGGLLVLFALYASFSSFRDVWGRRTTRYGLNALVMIGLVLAIIALVEGVSYRHSYRVDLTENRRHSLAPQTVKLLKELKVPVKATAFFRPDQPGKRTAEDLLKQYAAASEGKFTSEIVDADRNPGLARRYGIETYGTIVLEATQRDGQVKEEKVLDAEEEKLTNGLLRVLREGKRVLYVVKGHGERDPQSSERTGLAQLKAAIEKQHYEVKELLLAREPKVPDDAAIVVLAGPQKDPLATELDTLHAYVARGGKLFLLVDPFQASGFGAFLDRYGLGLGNDVIIDVNPLGRMFQAGPEIPVVADYPAHPITQGFRLATVFPEARTVTIKEKLPEGVTAQPLARTGADSWAELNQSEYRSGQVKRDPNEPRGPLTLAVAATVTPKDPAEAGKGAKARLIVIGDSDLVTNLFINVQGNRDFFLNALAWLGEEESLIAIRPKEPRNTPVFLTAAQGHVILWVPVVVMPLAMVVAGVYAVVRRRRR